MHCPVRPKLPQSASEPGFLQGLAFTFTRRGALGVGLTTGWGFALARLDKEGEPVRFSAPCYFSVHKLSIGGRIL